MPTPQLDAAAAGTWTLGELTVNRIGFGTKRLTGSGPFDLDAPGDRGRVTNLLRRVVELGINHIDTASFYPTHAYAQTDLRWANEMIREALSPYPDDLVIATKVGPGHDADGEWRVLVRPDQLRGQVEQNLRELGRDHLDVVNLRPVGLDSIAEHFGALAQLRDAGLIRHLGLSNIRPHHLEQAQAIAPIVCVQNRFGVDFGRINDELVRACGERGIAFVPFFALAGEGREDGGGGGQRRGAGDRPRPWGERGPGPARVDVEPRPACAGHPWYGRPRSPGRERRRRCAAPDRRGTG